MLINTTIHRLEFPLLCLHIEDIYLLIELEPFQLIFRKLVSSGDKKVSTIYNNRTTVDVLDCPAADINKDKKLL